MSKLVSYRYLWFFGQKQAFLASYLEFRRGRIQQLAIQEASSLAYHKAKTPHPYPSPNQNTTTLLSQPGRNRNIPYFSNLPSFVGL